MIKTKDQIYTIYHYDFYCLFFQQYNRKSWTTGLFVSAPYLFALGYISSRASTPAYLRSSVFIDKKKFTKSDGGTLESDWKTALPFSSHELLHSKIFLSPG